MTAAEFYDSFPAEWPAGAQYAALYADSSLEPGYRPQETAIPHKRYITRRGGGLAASYAGIADFETGNLVYTGTLLKEWALARRAAGHRFRPYCNRSDFARAYEQTGELGPQWWIATLDNDPRWTPDLIVASLKAMHGIVVAPAAIWGIQWGTNNRYDTSYLTGEW